MKLITMIVKESSTARRMPVHRPGLYGRNCDFYHKMLRFLVPFYHVLTDIIRANVGANIIMCFFEKQARRSSQRVGIAPMFGMFSMSNLSFSSLLLAPALECGTLQKEGLPLNIRVQKAKKWLKNAFFSLLSANV